MDRRGGAEQIGGENRLRGEVVGAAGVEGGEKPVGESAQVRNIVIGSRGGVGDEPVKIVGVHDCQRSMTGQGRTRAKRAW